MISCPREEGDVSLSLRGLEDAILDSGMVVKVSFLAKMADNDQEQMWPSVLAVQRWIELWKWR